MHERRQWIHLVMAIVILGGIACGPCNLLSGEMPTPPRPIVVSTAAAGQLEARIRQSLSGPPGRQFILRVTDAEVTSLLATELAKYDESPVADPRVWFTQGKIYGTGRLVNVLPVEARFAIVALARVRDGKIVVEIEKFSTGALPIPEKALQTISQSINETMDELQLEVEITTLEVLEGEAIIKGFRK